MKIMYTELRHSGVFKFIFVCTYLNFHDETATVYSTNGIFFAILPQFASFKISLHVVHKI